MSGFAGPADRLQCLLARVAEHLEDHSPSSADVAGLAAVCSASDAPCSLRVLAARVERGETTWEEVWRDPVAHDQAGLDLLGAVMGAEAPGPVV